MRSIELFAGCGGLALGISQAGFKPELLVEQDIHACSTLTNNIERKLKYVAGWRLLKEDVRNIDYSAWKGSIELVSGGPPCQPFSIGGKHKGPSDRRNMWPEGIRCVREVMPEAFIFENVRGLLRPAFSDYLAFLILQLRWVDLLQGKNENERQYRARLTKIDKKNINPKYHVLIRGINAADYGAPQKRHRAIILGFRSDVVSEIPFPIPTHSKEALIWDQYVSKEYWDRHEISISKRAPISTAKKKIVERLKVEGKPQEKPWVTVRDTISDLREPTKVAEIFNHEFHHGARVYVGHTGSQFDEPAKALKAGDHGVPGGENTLVYGHRVRYFTIREMARLQGFPDDFHIMGAWVNSMKQLGNAVPVQVARFFASQVYSVLSSPTNRPLKVL